MCLKTAILMAVWTRNKHFLTPTTRQRFYDSARAGFALLYAQTSYRMSFCPTAKSVLTPMIFANGLKLAKRGYPMQSKNAPKLLLSAREAARALSVCERTLWSLTQPRGPIPSIRLGARVLYPVAALQSWINSQVGAAEEGDKE